MTRILDQLRLTEAQTEAATAADGALVVTAGAGSGKTRTLAARFVALLEAGLPLRSLVAITFTDKAAREMRSRIRHVVASHLERCDTAERPPWEEIRAGLEAARVGTIHSLCARLLRAHPAEAGMDPTFQVLEENTSAMLKVRAVEGAMAWAAADSQASALFGPLTEFRLRQALRTLVDRRSDAEAAFEALGHEPLVAWETALREWLDSALCRPDWRQGLSALDRVQAHRENDRMEQARRAVLDHWSRAEAALVAGEWDAGLEELGALRQAIVTGGAKAHWDADALAEAREAMACLRTCYDERMAPLADRKKPVRWAVDRQAADLIRHLKSTFERALSEYSRSKEERTALDFDDLETLATVLLTGNSAVRARWQAEIRAVLVDEFQDTNVRQRRIVYSLSGFSNLHGTKKPTEPSGSLFVVGDAKQSIYRFRGADVAVFRGVQADAVAAGGRQIELDLTFRAHRPLVEILNALLAPILGHGEDAEQPFQVPFAALHAFREEPRPGVREPFVEYHVGVGEDAETGRQAAAEALAGRLRELSAEEGIVWSDVALLFRASTGFPPYEDALDRAGIPFVTVAGRGFYERPEVRDLLNALAAVADPSDDLALAGLLRSPAVGLPDAALYRLRFDDEGQRRPLWVALQAPRSELGPADGERAAFAQALVGEMAGLAGRVPVHEVLKRLLDLTHYRAALALRNTASPATAGGERLLRNVDKLLEDAHHSGLVSIAEFLEYVQTLRDTGAREGEAPTEAAGAVQLMTVHKAKGLEFPVIVIADASRSTHAGAPPVSVEAGWGVLLDLREGDARCTMHQLAAKRRAAMEEAESRRLLYVAATRAREKLIVSGYARISTAQSDPGRLLLGGWLAWLGEVVGLDAVRLPRLPERSQLLELAGGPGGVACVCHPLQVVPPPVNQDWNAETQRGRETEETPSEPPGLSASVPPRWMMGLTPASGAPALLSELTLLAGPGPAPVAVAADDKSRDRESDPPPRVWRVVPRSARPAGPAWVVGTLVHAALRRWRFPSEPDFAVFLYPHALDAGLTDPTEIMNAIRAVGRLLARFAMHLLFLEMGGAERYHEVPYVVDEERGVLDLLYRAGGGWTVAEFKTDRLADRAAMQRKIEEEGYHDQVIRYVRAVERLLGETPRALLIFMNVGSAIEVIEGQG